MPAPRRATRVPVTSAHCSWAALYCFRVWLRVSSQSMPSWGSVGCVPLSVTLPRAVPSEKVGARVTPVSAT